MTIIANGQKINAVKFKTEKDFEADIVSSCKTIFGRATIYIDAKKKIESKTLGSTIPDGFFFDFTDPTDPQFYIVEVELARHGFYEHIFPQVTKFFAFYKNTGQQKTLVDKVFSIVNTDPALKAEFRTHLGHTEIHKFLSDIIESSQKILLITDGSVSELAEIMETYTDTWGKMVRLLEIRKHVNKGNTVYSISPDIETLQYAEAADVSTGTEDSEADTPYTEDFHLDGVGDEVKKAYKRIKAFATGLGPEVAFNPQKYYISIKAPKNIAYLQIRKKKIRIVAMMPESRIRKIVRNHAVVSLSRPVQDFYSGPCAAVDIPDVSHIKEIRTLIRELIDYNK